MSFRAYIAGISPFFSTPYYIYACARVCTRVVGSKSKHCAKLIYAFSESAEFVFVSFQVVFVSVSLCFALLFDFPSL